MAAGVRVITYAVYTVLHGTQSRRATLQPLKWQEVPVRVSYREVRSFLRKGEKLSGSLRAIVTNLVATLAMILVMASLWSIYQADPQFLRTVPVEIIKLIGVFLP